MQERLQKVLARAGVASRRKAEEMITAGLVVVNGEVCATLGAKADPRRDRIRVAGKPLPAPAPPRHYLLYKPKGVVSTLRDPQGRPSVADVLAARLPRGGRSRERLYPVGRLDFASEGLLLITNDGDFAYRVTHASSALPKTYWVKVSGRPGEDQLAKLRAGIYLPPRRAAPAVRTAPAQVRWRPGGPNAPNPWLEMVLTEGRPNQIRRMMQAIGHRVEKLRRVRIGPLEAGGLKPGDLRPLTAPELLALRAALAGATAVPRNAGRRPPARPVAPERGQRRAAESLEMSRAGQTRGPQSPTPRFGVAGRGPRDRDPGVGRPGGVHRRTRSGPRG